MSWKRTYIFWTGLGLVLLLLWLNSGKDWSEVSPSQPTAPPTPTITVTRTVTIFSPPPAITNSGPAEAVIDLFPVKKVVDGDTINVEVDGAIEKVRLIGIDAPELDSSAPKDCFAQASYDRAKQLLDNQSVRLERDPTQADRDKYQRLLRYVLLADGTDVAKLLIAEGYAHEYTYQIPYQKQAGYQAAELSAQEGAKGLWASGACATNNQQPSTDNSKAPAASNTGADCQIKGNISSSGEKIYHIPGGDFYDKTQIDQAKGERYFCTEAEAEAAGWRPSKR